MFTCITREEDGTLVLASSEEPPDVSGMVERERYTAWNGTDAIVGYAATQEGEVDLYLIYRGAEAVSATDGAVGWFENATGWTVAREVPT